VASRASALSGTTMPAIVVRLARISIGACRRPRFRATPKASEVIAVRDHVRFAPTAWIS
jgi:hypothetical protein